MSIEHREVSEQNISKKTAGKAYVPTHIFPEIEQEERLTDQLQADALLSSESFQEVRNIRIPIPPVYNVQITPIHG